MQMQMCEGREKKCEINLRNIHPFDCRAIKVVYLDHSNRMPASISGMHVTVISTGLLCAAVSGLRRSMSKLRRPERRLWRTVRRLWRTVRRLWRTVCRLWSSMRWLWRAMHRVRASVLGMGTHMLDMSRHVFGLCAASSSSWWHLRRFLPVRRQVAPGGWARSLGQTRILLPDLARVLPILLDFPRTGTSLGVPTLGRTLWRQV